MHHFTRDFSRILDPTGSDIEAESEQHDNTETSHDNSSQRWVIRNDLTVGQLRKSSESLDT